MYVRKLGGFDGGRRRSISRFLSLGNRTIWAPRRAHLCQPHGSDEREHDAALSPIKLRRRGEQLLFVQYRAVPRTILCEACATGRTVAAASSVGTSSLQASLGRRSLGSGRNGNVGKCHPALVCGERHLAGSDDKVNLPGAVGRKSDGGNILRTCVRWPVFDNQQTRPPRRTLFHAFRQMAEAF